MNRVQQGESAILEVWAIDNAGAGVTSASINLKIRRSDSGNYWTGSTWGGATNVQMSETSSTNFPGHYTYTVTAPSADCDLQWFATSATSGVDNSPWGESLKVGGWADEFTVDAVSELSALPGSTPTRADMLQFIYEYFKHKKISTETSEVLYKDDGSTVLGTSTLAATASTFTRGEMS